MKKYEITENSKLVDNTTVYQIKALEDFGSVKKGKLGGYVETEDNLAHEGNCWVANSASVYQSARVCGNAVIAETARVFELAEISDNVLVLGNARVYGQAAVYDNAIIRGNAIAYCKARIFERVDVSDDAQIHGNAKVFGQAKIHQYGQVYNNAQASGSIQVCRFGQLVGNANVWGDAKIVSRVEYFNSPEEAKALDSAHELYTAEAFQEYINVCKSNNKVMPQFPPEYLNFLHENITLAKYADGSIFIQDIKCDIDGIIRGNINGVILGKVKGD